MNNKDKPAIEGGQPVRRKILNFSSASLGDEEITELSKTIKSGWLTYGPKSRDFEEKFSKYVNAKHAIALNSCTAGLHLSLLALGVGEGDEVITSVYTFAATSEVIINVGAKPIFVDIDKSLNIDCQKIEDSITSKTKAIIPVHFGGQPCDMHKIIEISKKYDMKIIEDAAHASGSDYQGRKIGNIGDCTVFSFYANKNMTTGEGGVVTTDNTEVAEKIRVLSLHGINSDAWNRFSSKGKWYYEILEAGWKYNFTDIQASLGLHQLEKLDGFNNKRQIIADEYLLSFRDEELVSHPKISDDIKHAWHLFPINIDFEKLSINRDYFIEALESEGIKTSVHYIPLHLHPYYRNKFKYKENDFPNALRCYNSVISLPIYPKMNKNDIYDVVSSVKKLINHYII